MPTGIGKTETMLALLVDQRLDRLLIVVPTTALREQTAAKFETLGVLVKSGVIGSAALYPVVGTLEHRPRTPEEVEEYFRSCNVVVTTMGVVSRCGEDVQRKMAEMCGHLFIDEAHHIQAPTWEIFRRFFADKIVLQFTATPFRGDGRHVDGEII
ncbi:MAG: DEAD/DEAH box helicase family protein [Rubrobacteraceae bacterium]|jgi:superfamily II DNA or RNA helicase|nr:DEAD/DEAH box helicase family protein [Rubrobacteraceae bacterium]